MSTFICKVANFPLEIVTYADFFLSSLRVAETVWSEGVLIKEYPPEAFTIKNLDDSWALLATEDGQSRYMFDLMGVEIQ